MKTHGKNRHVHFVDDVHVPAYFIAHTFAHNGLLHGFRQGVPGAKIHPLPGKPLNLDAFLLFHHRIVEGNFCQGLILAEKILIVGKINEPVGDIQHIAQLVGKYAAVPQSPLGNIGLGGFHVRFFLEGAHHSGGIGGFRDDVAVLFTGVGWLNAHEHQICLSLVRLGGELFQRGKVIVVDVGIHGAHHHGFLPGYPLDIRQIGGCQGNGREGVPAAGLHGNAHVVSQLVADGGYLGFGGGDGHGGIGVYRFDLPINPLHHGFIGAVGFLEKLDKLLGADIVGQRPQPLARPAG